VIVLTKVRELHVSPSAGGERAYLSAASGLVRAGPYLYVVADDELHLGVFRTTSDGPGHRVRLFAGELPASKPERKKLKPDLEALLKLPASERFPNGALLALGSGSTHMRRMGALLHLDSNGALAAMPQPVDLTPILKPLGRAFDGLNIEGAVVVGDEVRLFQRGNRGGSANAIIRFALVPFFDTLISPRESDLEPLAIHWTDLGDTCGIPFSFTDAAALPNGDVLFTAIAEDTEDTYNDGACVASAIGILSPDGKLRRLVPLAAPHKIEGVDARVEGGVITLLLVTDADDPEIPAVLYSATMER